MLIKPFKRTVDLKESDIVYMEVKKREKNNKARWLGFKLKNKQFIGDTINSEKDFKELKSKFEKKSNYGKFEFENKTYFLNKDDYSNTEYKNNEIIIAFNDKNRLYLITNNNIDPEKIIKQISKAMS